MSLKHLWTGLLSGALMLPVFSGLESKAGDFLDSSKKCTRSLIPFLSWTKKPIYESGEVPLYRDKEVITGYRQVCSGLDITLPGFCCPPRTINILPPSWVPETTSVREQVGTTKVYELKGFETEVNLCPEQLKTYCCTSCHERCE